MTDLLTLTDVELYYDHVYALKGVSLSVREGETVALIGANGAGKSSILRAITGLKKSARGRFAIEDKGSITCRPMKSYGSVSQWCRRAAAYSRICQSATTC
jgi:amino acid/amide ABC transporter ATP-binding protein 2, HAAT family (TC 3.A.1.4.-)